MTNLDPKTELFQMALIKWGNRLQEDIAIEEMSELIKALVKYRRDSNEHTREAVQEEIADVKICVQQLEMMFGQEKVSEFEEKKLSRLYNKINEARI